MAKPANTKARGARRANLFPPSFRSDLEEALSIDHELTPELAKCFQDDLYAFVHAPWAELLDAYQSFSKITKARVPHDRRVLDAAGNLRSALLDRDAFVSAALHSDAAPAGRALPAEPSRSRGVAFVRGQIDRLDQLTRSAVLTPINSPALTSVLNTLIDWAGPTLDEGRRWAPQRRRGRVGDHRREWLKHQAMRHLESIGIELSCTNHGVLANVLRVVLAAADRLEHKSPASRDNLRNDLKRLLSTYRRESNSTIGS